MTTPMSDREALARMAIDRLRMDGDREMIDRLKALLVPEDRMHPVGCSTWMQEAEYVIEWAADRLAALPPPAPSGVGETLQARVQPWMMACFGPEIAADRLERNDRFIEEALELVQASGYDKSRAHELVEYVYGRPQGDINQEVGGVMITLAAHCLAHGVDMHEAGETELARIWTKVEQIREKQKTKPKGSALPIPNAAPAPLPSGVGELKEAAEEIALLRKAMEEVKRELTITAAEYVPAIPACWEILDRALAR